MLHRRSALVADLLPGLAWRDDSLRDGPLGNHIAGSELRIIIYKESYNSLQDSFLTAALGGNQNSNFSW